MYLLIIFQIKFDIMINADSSTLISRLIYFAQLRLQDISIKKKWSWNPEILL